MAVTRLYTPRPYDSFDPGIAGVAPILAVGTDVDNTKLAAVQAAATAAGLGTLPTSAGGTAPSPTSAVLRLRGAWQANTAYQYGDVVQVVDGSGNVLAYSASLNFTSGSSFNAANWTELTFPGTNSAASSGLPSTIVSKTANYTASAGEFIEADTTSGGFTVTLPAAPAVGALVAVKKISADGNTLTIAASSGTIDGSATTTTATQWAGLVLEHKGSNVWRVAASMTTTGPVGPAGSVAVGTTTTGAAGSSASVTNTGTPTAALLNFTIPTGGAGPTGPAGGPLYFAFGDGTDGDATISGTTTLTKDTHYGNLTINSSGTLIPDGWRIYVRGTLTVNSGGKILMDGNDGGGTGLGGSPRGSNVRSLAQGSGGGSVNASTGAGAAGGTLANGAMSLGGGGGVGGASGGNAGGAGGSSGAMGTAVNTAPYTNSWRRPGVLIDGVQVTAVTNNGQVNGVIGVGSGGGGGANDGTGVGGGGAGGAGGGFVLINAYTVVNNGSISANGGAGGAGWSRNGGGGGGGGGGVVFINCYSFTGNTPTAAGGAGGALLGTGSAGVAGAAGTVHIWTMG